MLAPIIYLRKAIDISYCCPEEFDGSGYPQGVKVEEIPLTARIFAVIDVGDALTSDRPYGKAWSKSKTIAYSPEHNGEHFDPRVEEAFLLMISQVK
jgi:HD-GYP domain-containing protein (c-di-GMP phosphodiesterase class II)